MISSKIYGPDSKIEDNEKYYDCNFNGIRFDFWESNVFYECSFVGCDFYGCNELSFVNCMFRDCVVEDSTFLGWSNNFYNCQFDGANLYLHTTHMTECTGAEVPIACPSHGSFIAWKAAVDPETDEFVLVKLRIPAKAARCSAGNLKCRANEAQVLDIQKLSDKEISLERKTAYSTWDSNFIYTVGRTVKPTEPFNKNRWSECSSGIHFFIDRLEALKYGRLCE